MTNFNIKIVSDAICPWCYIGKKRLERAISIYKTTSPSSANDTFTVSWHPFYLDPTLPKTGIERRAHLERKYGPERMAMASVRIKQLGEEAGINFSLQGKIGNTRDAHRLVQLAKSKQGDAQDRLVSAMFKSHFEEDADITSREALVAIGEKAGLEKGEVESWLEQGKGGEEVDREVEEAYRRGISGVPHFTINDRYEIGGAQDVEAFLRVFARVKASSPDVSQGSSGEGQRC